jgi:hypothetical protein
MKFLKDFLECHEKLLDRSTSVSSVVTALRNSPLSIAQISDQMDSADFPDRFFLIDLEMMRETSLLMIFETKSLVSEDTRSSNL